MKRPWELLVNLIMDFNIHRHFKRSDHDFLSRGYPFKTYRNLRPVFATFSFHYQSRELLPDTSSCRWTLQKRNLFYRIIVYWQLCQEHPNAREGSIDWRGDNSSLRINISSEYQNKRQKWTATTEQSLEETLVGRVNIYLTIKHNPVIPPCLNSIAGN